MEILKIKTYKFEELGKEAKEQAFSDFREKQEIELDSFAVGVEEQLRELGFTDITLYYSLSYSQGGGLCFSAFIGLEKFLKAHKLYSKYKGLVGKVEFYIKKDTHQYQHMNTCDTIWEEYDGELSLEQEKQANELQKAIEEIREDLCRKFENDGYKEIERQQSEEYIEEEFRLGEYTFTKYGGRCVHLW